MSDCRHGGKDVPIATDAVLALMEEYERRITEVEQKAAALEELLGERNGFLEAMARQRERIAELEPLVREMFDAAAAGGFRVGEEADFARRLEELGIEVG